MFPGLIQYYIQYFILQNLNLVVIRTVRKWSGLMTPTVELTLTNNAAAEKQVSFQLFPSQ